MPLNWSTCSLQVGAIVVDGDAVKVTYAHNIDPSQTFGGCVPVPGPLQKLVNFRDKY